MSKILADNVRRLCKEQDKQMKDLAADMGIDPASLTRALNGNARLDTIEKIAKREIIKNGYTYPLEVKLEKTFFINIQ